MQAKTWWAGWILHGSLCCLFVVAGCEPARRVEPTQVLNRTVGPMTIAVAPAIDMDGSKAFDPVLFADVMATELGYVEGIAVIPVSRVTSLLATQGLETIDSPGHALDMARALGADGILVIAVNEYDPYSPPRIGITAQLYGARPQSGLRGVDATQISRGPRLASDGGRGTGPGLLAQEQRVFDSAHDYVEQQVRKFAESRDAGKSPYGWRRYVVSQRDYIRFCCHEMLMELFDDNGMMVGDTADTKVAMP